MSKNGVVIKYDNVAPGAKTSFVPNVSEKDAISNIEQLRKYNVLYPNYGNPCELYQTLLDGSSLPIPINDDINIGYWSKQISDSYGYFENDITIEFSADQLFSSQGITLTFDVDNNIFPTHINIKWNRDGSLISEKEFYPDSAIYVCENTVEYYNNITIVFYSINMPNNKLRIRSIDYGFAVEFAKDELQKVNVIQEINPISSEIAINTVDFDIKVDEGKEFLFLEKQAFMVYFDEKLIAKTFISSAKKSSPTNWAINTEDYIGIMENIIFYGDIYKNKNAYDLLEEIFTVANVPHKIDSGFKSVFVNGRIPYTNCRNALMQVAFCVQAVVDTSNSDLVNVFSFEEKEIKNIGFDQILQSNARKNTENKINGVEISIHSYNKSEPQNSEIVYDAKEDGSGENIVLVFNDPLYGLKISNGSSIIESNANYAIINAADDCILTGKKYKHTVQKKSKISDMILYGETIHITEIKDCTLSPVDNIDNLVNICYNYVVNNNVYDLSVIDGDNKENQYSTYGQLKYNESKYGEIIYNPSFYVGDLIITSNRSDLNYISGIKGRIIKQSFNLNGGMVVKRSTIKAGI